MQKKCMQKVYSDHSDKELTDNVTCTLNICSRLHIDCDCEGDENRKYELWNLNLDYWLHGTKILAPPMSMSRRVTQIGSGFSAKSREWILNNPYGSKDGKSGKIKTTLYLYFLSSCWNSFKSCENIYKYASSTFGNFGFKIHKFRWWPQKWQFTIHIAVNVNMITWIDKDTLVLWECESGNARTRVQEGTLIIFPSTGSTTYR